MYLECIKKNIVKILYKDKHEDKDRGCFKVRNIKEILELEEYKFLNENELKEKVAFLTLAGSRSYGTNISSDDYESDIDLRGILLHSKEEILTCNPREKSINKKDVDVVIYPLARAVHLLRNCNTELLPLLYVKDEHILKMTPEAKLLVDNADMFLSQKAIHSYGGFALNKMKEIESMITNGNNPNEEILASRLKKSLERQMEAFADKYTTLTKDECFKITDRDVKHRDELCINIRLEDYPVNSLTAMLSELADINRAFINYKKKEKISNAKQLAKSQMHLMRVLSMGVEILSGEGVQTYREKDRDLLLDIRSGKYTNSEVMEMINKKEAEFQYAKKHTVLPTSCDNDKIAEVVGEINLRCINK